jgi:hypothetical protein
LSTRKADAIHSTYTSVSAYLIFVGVIEEIINKHGQDNVLLLRNIKAKEIKGYCIT